MKTATMNVSTGNVSSGTQTKTVNAQLPRRHEVDALRSIALLLLIFYHAFIAFQPIAVSVFMIGHSPTLERVYFIGDMLNTWRIPVLFLISGITAGYLLQNRSVGKLLSSRLLRLVPPLLFTSIFVAPISFMLFQHYYDQDVMYSPNPAHLWFVTNLVVYFVYSVPLRLYLKHRPGNLFLRVLKILTPWGWLIVIPLWLTVVSWLLEPMLSQYMFSAHVFRFWNGLACFLAGIALVSLGEPFWRGIRLVCHVALPAALVLLGMRILQLFTVEGFLRVFVLTLESSCFMLAFLGYGSLLFSQPSRLFSFLNRSVFAVYIIHLPVQQAIAYVLFSLEQNPLVAFPLHLAATLAVCYAIYGFILLPMRWLHPFMGIAPVKRRPSPETPGLETASRSISWPVRVGRFATLYVITPLLVIGMSGVLVFSAYVQSAVQGAGQIGESEFVGLGDRFRSEIQTRSMEENYAEASQIMVTLRQSIEERNVDRAWVLAWEIQLMMEFIANAGAFHSSEEDTGADRFRDEVEERSNEMNARYLQGVLLALEEAITVENAGLAEDRATELQIILEALSEEQESSE